MPNFKSGVDHSDMSEHITSKYDAMDRVCRKHAKRDCVITSARDGKHMSGSRHYSGEAIDLRTRDIDKSTTEKIVNDLKSELGRDYDVVLEKDHIHLEYDPR